MILFLFSIFNMKKLFSIVSPPTFHLAPRSLPGIFGPQNKQGKSNWRNDLNQKRRQKVSKSTDDMRRHQLGSDPIFSMSKIETSYFEDTFLNFRTIKYTQWRTKKKWVKYHTPKTGLSHLCWFFSAWFFSNEHFCRWITRRLPLGHGLTWLCTRRVQYSSGGSPWIREVDACMGFTEDQELEINLYTAIYNEGGGF